VRLALLLRAQRAGLAVVALAPDFLVAGRRDLVDDVARDVERRVLGELA
jgi:hypothetical protein